MHYVRKREVGLYAHLRVNCVSTFVCLCVLVAFLCAVCDIQHAEYMWYTCDFQVTTLVLFI